MERSLAYLACILAVSVAGCSAVGSVSSSEREFAGQVSQHLVHGNVDNVLSLVDPRTQSPNTRRHLQGLSDRVAGCQISIIEIIQTENWRIPSTWAKVILEGCQADRMQLGLAKDSNGNWRLHDRDLEQAVHFTPRA